MSLSASQVTIGIAAAALVSFAAYRTKSLTADGAVAAFAVGALVFGIGGLPYSVPILTFFITSSLLSAVGRTRKQRLYSRPVRYDPRNAWQVVANGGIPAFIVCAAALLPPGATPSSRDWFLLYLSALASANADTWATEIGTLAPGRPVHITTFRPVLPGTSGAVSLLGTLAGLAGAAAVTVSGWLAWPEGSELLVWRMDVAEGLAVLWAGFLGSLTDSVLGATIQAMYECARCGKVVETGRHCGAPARLLSGRRWVTNDAVNALASLAAVAAAWILLRYFAWPLK